MDTNKNYMRAYDRSKKYVRNVESVAHCNFAMILKFMLHFIRLFFRIFVLKLNNIFYESFKINQITQFLMKSEHN